MSRLAPILLSVLIQGCSTTATFYIPDQGNGKVHIHTDANCTAPSASYQFDLADDVNGYVSASATADGWGIFYGFNLPKGSKLQVIDPIIGVRIMDTADEMNLRMEDFRLSVYGGLPGRPAGYYEDFSSDAELVYSGLNEGLDVDYLRYDTFRSGVLISGRRPMHFELKFPALLVNDEIVDLDPITMRYVEQRYRDFCIQ